MLLEGVEPGLGHRGEVHSLQFARGVGPHVRVAVALGVGAGLLAQYLRDLELVHMIGVFLQKYCVSL